MLELLLSVGSAKLGGFKWVNQPAWPVKLRGPAVAAVGNKIWSFGGSRAQEGSETHAEYNYPNTLISYDTITGEYVRTTASILGRTNAYACGVGNTLYVMGGYSASTSDPQLREYNTLNNTWTSRISLPSARTCNGLIAHNGFVYATTYDAPLKRTILYQWNPTVPTNNWVQMGVFPAGSYNGGAIIGFEDSIYYIGGRFDGTLSTAVFKYSITPNTWIQLASLPTGYDTVKPFISKSVLYLLKIDSVSPPLTYKFYEQTPPTLVNTSTGNYHPVAYAGLATLNNKTYLIGGFSSIAPTGLQDQNIYITQ